MMIDLSDPEQLFRFQVREEQTRALKLLAERKKKAQESGNTLLSLAIGELRKLIARYDPQEFVDAIKSAPEA